MYVICLFCFPHILCDICQIYFTNLLGCSDARCDVLRHAMLHNSCTCTRRWLFKTNWKQAAVFGRKKNNTQRAKNVCVCTWTRPSLRVVYVYSVWACSYVLEISISNREHLSSLLELVCISLGRNAIACGNHRKRSLNNRFGLLLPWWN